MKITNLTRKKGKLALVAPPNTDADELITVLSSALNSAKRARSYPDAKETHLRNCRDAITRADFYVNDELDGNEG